MEELNSFFPLARDIVESEIDAIKLTFDLQSPQKLFRWKYEMEFLYHILNNLILEFSKTSNRFGEKRKIKLTLSKQNLLSELTQYADTPDCLLEYLSIFA